MHGQCSTRLKYQGRTCFTNTRQTPVLQILDKYGHLFTNNRQTPVLQIINKHLFSWKTMVISECAKSINFVTYRFNTCKSYYKFKYKYIILCSVGCVRIVLVQISILVHVTCNFKLWAVVPNVTLYWEWSSMGFSVTFVPGPFPSLIQSTSSSV